MTLLTSGTVVATQVLRCFSITIVHGLKLQNLFLTHTAVHIVQIMCQDTSVNEVEGESSISMVLMRTLRIIRLRAGGARVIKGNEPFLRYYQHGNEPVCERRKRHKLKMSLRWLTEQ